MAGELNTEVLDEPATCRDTADWLGKLGTGTGEVIDVVSEQRGASESFWTGTAADAARGELGRRSKQAQELEEALGKVESALRAFADEIETVDSRMAAARGVARQAGLVINGTKILPPKPSPAGESGSPSAPGKAAEKRQRAFEEAGDIVVDAREKQERAHRELESAMQDPNETFNAVKTHVTRSLTGGLTAIKTSTESAAALFEQADALEDKAREMRNLAKAADHSSDAAKARVAAMQYGAKSKVADARGAKTGAFSEKVPSSLRRAATADAVGLLGDGAKMASNAKPVLRGLPYVGTAITVASETTDVATGTHGVGEAAMDAGASLGGAAVGGAAGAAIGSAIFPGVGTVVGGAVGSMAGDFLATSAENWLTGE